MKTLISVGAAMALTVTFASALWAVASFEQPGGHAQQPKNIPRIVAPPSQRLATRVNMGTIALKGQKAAPKARGTAMLVCSSDNSQNELTITASGLDSKKLYTVWLMKVVKAKKNGKETPVAVMEGVGDAPYTLTVQKNGTARLATEVKTCLPNAGWKILKVLEHPDKNLKNLKGAVTVMTGDVTKFSAK